MSGNVTLQAKIKIKIIFLFIGTSRQARSTRPQRTNGSKWTYWASWSKRPSRSRGAARARGD